MNEFNKEEFNAAVQAEVDRQLSSREEAEARREAEEALNEAKETFETLKASLEAKDAKIAEYEETLANLDTSEPTAAEVAANEKIVELEKAVEELTERSKVAEAALDTIAREETAAGRMAELTEAGVSLDEEAAEAQYAKIRDMSDEDFQSYKSELVALKNKYAPASEEEGEEKIEVAELSAQEINLIAQSLGCDPSDAKCISLVREVADKVAEVSQNRRQAPAEEAEEGKKTEEAENNEEASEGTETPNKETASKKEETPKLSLGEAISRSMDQEIQAPADLKEELAQEWEKLYAERRGETDNSE
jgi:hypothetical protein